MKAFSTLLSASALVALASLSASAQPAPPAPGSAPGAVPPSPPAAPPGPRADRGPPPPPGPSIRVERDPGGTMRLDVHCGQADTARSCADTTLAIFDKVNAPAK